MDNRSSGQEMTKYLFETGPEPDFDVDFKVRNTYGLIEYRDINGVKHLIKNDGLPRGVI